MMTTALLGLWVTCASPASCGALPSASVARDRIQPLIAHDGTADRGDAIAAVDAADDDVEEADDVSPTAYVAITNRAAYPKPPVPALGPAGYWLNDPTFGSRILRVTDGNTRPGAPNRSYRVASNAHLATWNTTSTAFYVISNDGTPIPYSFNPATMTAQRIRATGSGDGGLTLAFYVEPHFSVTNPNVIYGVSSGGNNRTIMKYDFTTDTYSTVVDLDTVVGGLSGTYVGSAMTAGNPETLMTFFGGAAQDSHFYLMLAPLGNLSARKVMNTVASTINGRSTNVTLNFHIHSAAIERSGRYVFIYPTSVDLAAPRSAAQVYLWDTWTDQITPLPVSAKSGGHDAFGFGYSVNQDCCTSSTWDAMQWQFRNLANPTSTNDLISPVLTPKEIYLDDHTSWNNARPDALVPVISSTYRYYPSYNTTPWRAWDDEIIAVDTSNGVGGTVWRFAHHRSDTGSDSDPNSLYFWYEPIASVSPDGRWVMFTSNWEKTLGRDSSEGTYRQDVFVVQLLASGSAAPPPSVTSAPAPGPVSAPAPTTPSSPTSSTATTSAPGAPGAPLLTSAVSGSTVTLDWSPGSGSAATAYVVEAGSSPGLSDLASVTTALPHFVASGVWPGVYFVRVRGVNGVGTGAASNETVVSVGPAASTSAPGAASNAVASIAGRDVTLEWNAASGASSYIVEAGSAPGLADLAVINTGSTATAFFAPNVTPGVYYVRIRAANAAGAGGASNEVVVVVR